MTRTPDAVAVEQQLERIAQHPIFSVSARMVTLLRFLCSETLKPDGVALKEATIGNALYQREPPYDPRIDCTVRVEARRLRRKLEAYYAAEGAADPVRIDLPVGGYVPRFSAAAPRPRSFRRTDPVSVRITIEINEPQGLTVWSERVELDRGEPLRERVAALAADAIRASHRRATMAH